MSHFYSNLKRYEAKKESQHHGKSYFNLETKEGQNLGKYYFNLETTTMMD